MALLSNTRQLYLRYHVANVLDRVRFGNKPKQDTVYHHKLKTHRKQSSDNKVSDIAEAVGQVILFSNSRTDQ